MTALAKLVDLNSEREPTTIKGLFRVGIPLQLVDHILLTGERSLGLGRCRDRLRQYRSTPSAPPAVGGASAVKVKNQKHSAVTG